MPRAINICMTTDFIEELPSAWKGHRGFAHWLVQYIQPKITVELGVDYGYSTFVLAQNNPGQVYGIDLFEGDEHAGHRDAEQYQKVLAFKTLHSFDNVQLIKDTFDNVNATWASPVDVLHIDGLHTGKAVEHDLITWSRFFHANTVVLMHDVSSFEEVEDVFIRIPQPKLRFIHSGGLGVLCQNTEILRAIKAHWVDDIFDEQELVHPARYDVVMRRYKNDQNVRLSQS